MKQKLITVLFAANLFLAGCNSSILAISGLNWFTAVGLVCNIVVLLICLFTW